MNQENDKKQKTEKQETTNNGSQQQNNETVQLIKAAEIIKNVKGTSKNFSVDNEGTGNKKQEGGDD